MGYFTSDFQFCESYVLCSSGVTLKEEWNQASIQKKAMW